MTEPTPPAHSIPSLTRSPAIRGRAVRTQTGELSIDVTHLPQLLSPSLVPLPFKLEEEDAKVHNRHIDMLVNRETADVLRLRSYIMKYMRDFFHDQGFLEFQTPILAENAGEHTTGCLDRVVHLKVRALDHLGARLVTSPAGRGLAFFLDFSAALVRAARGDSRHPEERR